MEESPLDVFATKRYSGRLNPVTMEPDPKGVLPWRLDRAAYLARQFSTPTTYGRSRQVARMEKRKAWRLKTPRTFR